MTDLATLIQSLKAAKEGTRELDAKIHASKFPSYGSHGMWQYWIGRECPAYTTSVDAALSLYKTKPERVPSDPLKACIARIQAWWRVVRGMVSMPLLARSLTMLKAISMRIAGTAIAGVPLRKDRHERRYDD